MATSISSLAKNLLMGVVGWLVVAPIAALVPRKLHWIAVIGRDDGKFLDNAKHFFLQSGNLAAVGTRVVFVTERRDVADLLKKSSLDVVIHPTWDSYRLLARVGTTVVDSSEWYRRFRRFLLIRSRIVQLWHGVGFKFVELDLWKNQTGRTRIFALSNLFPLRKLAYRLTGRLVRYDLLNTTSAFYRDAVFTSAFKSREISTFGYPRNSFDRFRANNEGADWLNVDPAIASKLQEWVKNDKRIVLVTPTFRDSRATRMQLDSETVEFLDAFAEEHKLEFVFKFHPIERDTGAIRGRHLHRCDPHSDLYPIMPFAHAMISDYSSIYMDYLLLNRPVVFFVPDLEEYLRRDRQLQFDFAAMTPGPKVGSWKDVVIELLKQWNDDEYSEQRAALKKRAFDGLDQSQAVSKLLSLMRAKRFIH